MKKIYVIIALLGTMILGACSDFLDEATDKSGSAYIYHMDQLYGLMGSIDLYLFNNNNFSVSLNCITLLIVFYVSIL